jgi:hypothetical protein
MKELGNFMRLKDVMKFDFGDFLARARFLFFFIGCCFFLWKLQQALYIHTTTNYFTRERERERERWEMTGTPYYIFSNQSCQHTTHIHGT